MTPRFAVFMREGLYAIAEVEWTTNRLGLMKSTQPTISAIAIKKRERTSSIGDRTGEISYIVRPPSLLVNINLNFDAGCFVIKVIADPVSITCKHS